MNINIEAKIRNIGTKSDIKNLRKEGFIPGILYGEGKKGINITLEKIPFLKQYKKTIGETAFFNISIEDKSYISYIKEKQVHPVSREFMHIDFIEIHKGKEITMEIPLKILNEHAVHEKGGMLDVVMRKLNVTCLPKDIPEFIEVDVSDINIGESLSIKDVKMDNLRADHADDTTLVTVFAPKTEQKLAEELGEVEEPEETTEDEESKEKESES